MMWGCVLAARDSRRRPVLDSSDHLTENSGSVNGAKFLDQLSEMRTAFHIWAFNLSGSCLFVETELYLFVETELCLFVETELYLFVETWLCLFVETELYLFVETELCLFVGTELRLFVETELCLFVEIELCLFIETELCLFVETELCLFVETESYPLVTIHKYQNKELKYVGRLDVIHC